MMLRKLICAVAAASLAGCMTMYTVNGPVSPATVQEHLAVGDKVRVQTKNGVVYPIEITAIDATGVTGYDHDARKSWKMPYSQIARIDYKRVSLATKVTAYTGGLVVTGYVILAVIALIAIATL